MSPRSVFARRLRRRAQRGLVAIPLVYLAAAIVLGDVAPALDRRVDPPFGLDVDIDTTRAILGATATGMIAFTALVVSSVLLVVQFAAAQYSPRLVLWFRRDPIVKHAIGSFLATFLYSLVALREVRPHRGDTSPDVTVALALLLLGAATILFLVLLERVRDRLRPRTLYGAVAGEGIRAATAIYPHTLDEQLHDDRRWSVPDPRVVTYRGRPGVIVSFEREALLGVAVAAGATLELVPGVGEFLGPGQPLLRVHGTVGATDETLTRAVDVADERTIRQDPAFALRIIVDTAIRALSPAVNDPTTAANALDVLELVMRELAGRDLEASVARGPDGAVRVAWRSPSWPDPARSRVRRDPLLRRVVAADRAAPACGAGGPARHDTAAAPSRARRTARPARRRRARRPSGGVARARRRAARRPARAGPQPLSRRRRWLPRSPPVQDCAPRRP